ncbi:hypothetical protein KUCAC02_037001 [Xyrichtys novacula]|uniref:Uncharacterized protein n=1 Tax=Xyrichtys novacula TaxID=13765 RepID=A0AAV1FAJ0_XYRNO|nr:hypothetical protein KUCAC02_037001 [Xyrichtys novacula]
MALRKLLDSRPPTPYFKLPPLHVVFLKIEDSPRVVSWAFGESSATPTCTKLNKMAIISDGESLAKITLFEAVAGKVAEGEAFFMRGHTLVGKSPPFLINVGSGTQFFRASKIACPAELLARAETLLHPASPLVELSQCREQQGLISIEGVITEISAVRKVESGREALPLRKLTLQQGKTTVRVSLWREAAVKPLAVGETVRVTHTKSLKTEYGLQLNSTNFTKLEKQLQTGIELTIIGVLEEEGATSSSGPELLEVLQENGETLRILKDLWGPNFDEALLKGPLKCTACVSGTNIVKLKLI